eukprot:TRINITY_DN4872_c0_g1_i1.p1 TRINITY_DN4872_c0_g1~~TRINITY_DN4872_c0_g1_i1.p1  ORF type:complete len:387 (+),score=57.63 TRINITY_DN4872_c0_g1_i1:555-1715(+)
MVQSTLILACLLMLSIVSCIDGSISSVTSFNLTTLPGGSKYQSFTHGRAITKDCEKIYMVVPNPSLEPLPPYPFPFYFIEMSTSPLGKVLNNITLYKNGDTWGDASLKNIFSVLLSSDESTAYIIVYGRPNYGIFYYYLFTVDLASFKVVKSAHRMTFSNYYPAYASIDFVYNSISNTIVWINENSTGFDVINLSNYNTYNTGDLGVGTPLFWDTDTTNANIYFVSQGKTSLSLNIFDSSKLKLASQSIQFPAICSTSYGISFVPNTNNNPAYLVSAWNCNQTEGVEYQIGLLDTNTLKIVTNFTLGQQTTINKLSSSQQYAWFSTNSDEGDTISNVNVNTFTQKNVQSVSYNSWSVIDQLTPLSQDLAFFYLLDGQTLQLLELKS